MRFDPIDTFDVTRHTTGLVVRPRRWPTLAIAALFLCIGAGVATFAPEPLIKLAVGAFCLLFATLFVLAFRALGRPWAWLLALEGQEGLSVMLRSPFRVPVDPREQTLVTLAWSEIAWARRTRITRTVVRQGKRKTSSWTYLDVALAPGVDPAPLAAAVEVAQGTRSWLRDTHVQARLVDGNVLRLAYGGSAMSMTPSLPTLLRELEGRVTVAPESHERV